MQNETLSWALLYMTYFEEMLHSFKILHDVKKVLLHALVVKHLFRPEQRLRLAEAFLREEAVHDVLQQKTSH